MRTFWIIVSDYSVLNYKFALNLYYLFAKNELMEVVYLFPENRREIKKLTESGINRYNF